MRQKSPFLVGAGLAVGLLLILWAAVVYQCGTVRNGFRYLQGYSYVVDPTTIDVGKGVRGETRMATTRVRNLSFSRIRVVGAVTTCNCLAVTGLPLTIEPRQSQELELKIYLEPKNGNVEQIANVLIDDGQMQRVTVLITGNCSLPKSADH